MKVVYGRAEPAPLTEVWRSPRDCWRSSGRYETPSAKVSEFEKVRTHWPAHKTSVSLEDAFWKDVQEIAAIRNVSLSDLLAMIDTGRHYGGLSSAIRLFVLEHYRKSAERHRKGRSPHGVAWRER
jgi:predicted DNA-binding ribbon-helix-helix protein